jgi:hypothetical protein
MPTDSKILGFSNQWYEESIEIKIQKTLPDETVVFVFPPEYYFAAKFEAHNARGGNDLRQSHDFEDIIYILDNCSEILENVRVSNPSVKMFLKNECQKLMDNPNITEGIESAIPYGSGEGSSDILGILIRNIAQI